MLAPRMNAASCGAVDRFMGSFAGVMIAPTIFDIWALAVVQRELKRQEFIR